MEWNWLKRYRAWQASRKEFLAPENWLEPELRDDKTPVFPTELTSLPGHELVLAGLDDLARGVESQEALLVAIGAPRLRAAGIDVPDAFDSPSTGSTTGSPPRIQTRPTAATTRWFGGLSASSALPMRERAY